MGLKDFVQIVIFCIVFENTTFRLVLAQSRSEITTDPINYYTTVELACSEGYPIQEHQIETKDGYILTVHRIPHGKFRPKIPRNNNHYRKIHLEHHPDFEDCVQESRNETSTGTPVILAHGVLMASDGWLLQGPGYDLAYILVDNGYDVWMVNTRGNFYSRKHKTLSPSDAKFWDFSFHEHAVYDLPAIIDHIQKLTNKEKVGYIGLSMGTTIFFSMSSLLPEYNNKILGFIGLAPVGYLKDDHMDARKRAVFEIFAGLVKELKKKNVNELFHRSTRWVDFGRFYCSKGSQLQNFCYDLVSVILGFQSKLVLKNIFHLYLTHMPAGTSLKNFQHYNQNIKGNCFKQFDYGPEKNIELYGTPKPPDYPLKNITAPVALYYSLADFWCNAKDLRELEAALPNVIDVDISRKFNHGDYLWSFRARDIVYPKVLNFFKKLRNEYNFQNRIESTNREGKFKND